MMRWRSGVAVGFLALVAAGCGGTTSQIGTGASILVPKTAPAFVAIDTDPSSSQWQTIDQLASRFPDKQKAVDSIKSDLTKQGVDWEQDVKPALGKELDFVWLDFKNNGQDFVALTQPQDSGKFESLIRKANASEKDPTNRAVYDTFQGWEVIATSQAMIDRFKRESSTSTPLADEKTFKQAMGRLGGNSVVRAYVNGGFLMKLAHTYGGARIEPYLTKLGTLDWIALRFGATSAGIGVDTIVHGTPGTLLKGAPSSSAFSPKLIGTVPQDALLYLTFHGTKGMFNGLQRNSLFNQPQYRQFERPLQQIGQLLEGENAVYVRPQTSHSIPEITLVAGNGGGGTSTLDQLIRKYVHRVPTVRYLNGAEVHGFDAGGLGLFYGNVGGKLVVTDQLGGIRDFGNTKALDKNSDFNDARHASGLPGKTYGFLYVNINSTVPLVEKLSHSKLPAEIARNVAPLRSAMEYAASRSHEFQVTFFLRIK
jgi:Protein of unknown function (DUF3352)